jgi:hypothetical protein
VSESAAPSFEELQAASSTRAKSSAVRVGMIQSGCGVAERVGMTEWKRTVGGGAIHTSIGPQTSAD